MNLFGRKKVDSPFVALAKKGELDQETAFTICMMIDAVGHDIVDDWDWDWLEGEALDYRSLINPSILEKAWKKLAEKEWFSLQTTNNVDKRISTITPLAGMTRLRTLVLQNNLIEDLGPISGLVRLKELSCSRNQIRDLTLLENLTLLEELSVGSNPVESLQVLERLPVLRELSISVRQMPVFTQCKRLSHVEVLYISFDDTSDKNEGIENFTGLPEMPSLRNLTAWRANDISGLERFPTLENLSLPDGKVASLEALRGLKNLTHFSVSTPAVIDAEPSGELNALRSLSLNGAKVVGLASLTGLPALHELRMNDEATADAGELEALREGMVSMDTEFKADSARFKPQLRLEVVDQATFDRYDSRSPFGLRPGESNQEMLESEREWLVEEIREALSVKFEDDTDFHLPYSGGFQRTERVIIYGIEAYESFREIALAIQNILCEARNDWIIWCQSLLWESTEEQEIPDGTEDFIVWIYADKIMVAEEHANTVRKLIEWGS